MHTEMWMVLEVMVLMMVDRLPISSQYWRFRQGRSNVVTTTFAAISIFIVPTVVGSTAATAVAAI